MIVTATRLGRRSMLNFMEESNHQEIQQREQISGNLTEPEDKPILSVEQYARFMRSCRSLEGLGHDRSRLHVPI